MFRGRPAGTGAEGRTPGTIVPGWRPAVLWLGAAMCAVGLATTLPWDEWQPERAKYTAILAASSWLLAMSTSVLCRIRCATALALWFGLALVRFSGAMPFAATVLFGLASVAAGTAIAPRAPAALKCLAGMVAIAGLAAWSLPVRVHADWIYAALLFGLVA